MGKTKSLRKTAHPADRLADSLSDVQRSLSGLTPVQRHAAMLANRNAQAAYLRHMSPQAAEAASVGRSTDELIGNAQKLRKRDPSMTEFESLRRAVRVA